MDISKKLSLREYTDIEKYLKGIYGEKSIVSFFPEGKISVKISLETDLIWLKIEEDYWIDTLEEEREKELAEEKEKEKREMLNAIQCLGEL